MPSDVYPYRRTDSYLPTLDRRHSHNCSWPNRLPCDSHSYRKHHPDNYSGNHLAPSDPCNNGCSNSNPSRNGGTSDCGGNCATLADAGSNDRAHPDARGNAVAHSNTGPRGHAYAGPSYAATNGYAGADRDSGSTHNGSRRPWQPIPGGYNPHRRCAIDGRSGTRGR